MQAQAWEWGQCFWDCLGWGNANRGETSSILPQTSHKTPHTFHKTAFEHKHQLLWAHTQEWGLRNHEEWGLPQLLGIVLLYLRPLLHKLHILLYQFQPGLRVLVDDVILVLGRRNIYIYINNEWEWESERERKCTRDGWSPLDKNDGTFHWMSDVI